jgi:hypothetical protein
MDLQSSNLSSIKVQSIMLHTSSSIHMSLFVAIYELQSPLLVVGIELQRRAPKAF